MRVTKLAARLGFVGVVSLVAGIAFGRPELIVLAAPALAALAAAVRQREPAPIAARATLSAERCCEGDDVEIEVRVQPDPTYGAVDLELRLPREIALVGGASRQSTYGPGEARAHWVVRPARWGRHSVGQVEIRVRSKGFAYVLGTRLDLDELTVFPPAADPEDVAVPPRLLARLGSHVARRPGSGVEFAEVRPYAPGDAIRQVNWPVSSRRGDLYVDARLAERAADVVAIVDVTVDAGSWRQSSLDRAVRGAAAVVQAYLRYSDRVGVVALGGSVRWLTPDLGMRQYYRIVETLLAARGDDSELDPELTRLPRHALPPGSLVFVFTPLLHPRLIEAIRDLRQRGHPVVAVDVLASEPPRHPGREGDLALRIWRLEREVTLHGLTSMGVTVVRWDEENGIPLERARLEPFLGAIR